MGQQWHGLGHLAGGHQHACEHDLGRRAARILRPEGCLSGAQAPTRQADGLLRIERVGVELGEDLEHLVADLGLRRERLVDAIRAGDQHVVHGRLAHLHATTLHRGSRLLEQVQQEALDGDCALRLALGLALLDDCAGHAPHHREHDQRCGTGAKPVPANELVSAIQRAVGPRRDRPLVERALQVVGEIGHRTVALGGVCLDRLADDHGHVAVQRLAQRRHTGGAPVRDALRRGAVRWQGPKQPRLIGQRRRAQRRGRGIAAEGSRAAEQPEEHQPETVDIGRGGHDAAAQLLGRGVLGCHGRACRARQFRDLARLAAIVGQQLRHAEVE